MPQIAPPAILPWLSQAQAYALLRELAEANLEIARLKAERNRLRETMLEAARTDT